MDIVIVRTKLQACIALNLIESGEISKRFIFIKNFWRAQNEDSSKTHDTYLQISKKALATSFFIEAKGTLRGTIFIWLLSLIPLLTNGKILFAGVNLYSFALVAKFNPLLKINTFDDGSANIRGHSIYYSEEPLPKSKKIGTSAINFFFKKGAAFYLRQRTLLHFSIYPGRDNIVPDLKIKFIHLNLGIDDSDSKILLNILKPKMRILVGTTFEHPYNILSFLKRNFENFFDLIILHPRDTTSLRLWNNAFHFNSIAENIISSLENSSTVTDIDVYHFSSSVSDTFKNNKKISLIDIFKKFPTEDEQTFNHIENFLVYVDTNPHLVMALEIEKRFSWAKFTYCTDKEEIFNRLDPSKDILFKNRLEILKYCFWEIEEKFTAVLAARVDDLTFQLLYKLLPPLKIYTFDEGLFTIQSDSIYNSQENFTRKSGIKRYLSYKFFKFPIPASYFYKNNFFHFTHFHNENFSRSLIDKKKLKYIQPSFKQKGIKKIFVGQPWQYMHFSQSSLENLSRFINRSSIDIYLIHPRENITLIDKNLHMNISRIRCFSSSESFVNQLMLDQDVEIYTVASTLVLGLEKSTKINIVHSSSFDEKIIYGQENLGNVLEVEGFNFHIINID
ncbi:glycosyltransferase family 52 protein [Gammaproteobacteria bacterium]|nr:glycosyltransferase family 52 protein [Gammaproteobacteria bacterium]MDC0129013.1 glycosyltransferase family 52 protein [Gammaproteobacteria bacterium]